MATLNSASDQDRVLDFSSGILTRECIRVTKKTDQGAISEHKWCHRSLGFVGSGMNQAIRRSSIDHAKNVAQTLRRFLEGAEGPDRSNSPSSNHARWLHVAALFSR
jgi:hypothetical protein